MFYLYVIRAQVQCVGYAVVEVCLPNLIRDNEHSDQKCHISIDLINNVSQSQRLNSGFISHFI